MEVNNNFKISAKTCANKIKTKGLKSNIPTVGITRLIGVVHHGDRRTTVVESPANRVQDRRFARADAAIDHNQPALVADGILTLGHALGVAGCQV